MKTHLTILLLFIVTIGSSPAIEQSKLDAFKTELENALKAKDLKALSECFYWKDTPQALIDQAIYGYQQNLAMGGLNEITFISLDDKALNPRFIDSYVKGANMNGRIYKPNLDVIMLCSVKFKDSSGSSSFATTSPIGVAPDGKIRFTGTSVTEASKTEQGAAANP